MGVESCAARTQPYRYLRMPSLTLSLLSIFITQPDNILLVAGVADNRAAELLVEVCWHGEINSDAPAHPTITAARRREEINSLSAF